MVWKRCRCRRCVVWNGVWGEEVGQREGELEFGVGVNRRLEGEDSLGMVRSWGRREKEEDVSWRRDVKRQSGKRQGK